MNKIYQGPKSKVQYLKDVKIWTKYIKDKKVRTNIQGCVKRGHARDITPTQCHGYYNYLDKDWFDLVKTKSGWYSILLMKKSFYGII